MASCAVRANPSARSCRDVRPDDSPVLRLRNHASGSATAHNYRHQHLPGGQLIYLRITYTDPDGDATGFGFRGANGSGWAEEQHPFTAPSYGRVGPGYIDYPFNHGCGTDRAIRTSVTAWIYDSRSARSTPVTVTLTCS
jgi:hypothetical protein